MLPQICAQLSIWIILFLDPEEPQPVHITSLKVRGATKIPSQIKSAVDYSFLQVEIFITSLELINIQKAYHLM